jgi:hypothetical protein
LVLQIVGRTSLYPHLDRHPQIFTSRAFFACSPDEAPHTGYKEKHLPEGVKNDVNTYRHLFDSTKGAAGQG